MKIMFLCMLTVSSVSVCSQEKLGWNDKLHPLKRDNSLLNFNNYIIRISLKDFFSDLKSELEIYIASCPVNSYNYPEQAEICARSKLFYTEILNRVEKISSEKIECENCNKPKVVQAAEECPKTTQIKEPSSLYKTVGIVASVSFFCGYLFAKLIQKFS